MRFDSYTDAFGTTTTAKPTSFVTSGIVGISNSSPTDTLSVGSKFHVNVDSSNVLTVLGNTYIQDRLIVNGDAIFNGLVTAVHSNNTVISDAIIEIGKNNSVNIGINIKVFSITLIIATLHVAEKA